MSRSILAHSLLGRGRYRPDIPGFAGRRTSTCSPTPAAVHEWEGLYERRSMYPCAPDGFGDGADQRRVRAGQSQHWLASPLAKSELFGSRRRQTLVTVGLDAFENGRRIYPVPL